MSCSYYTFRQNDYYCNKKGDYVNSDVYYKYCRNYDYDDCPIYKQEDSSGCYLTTIVCDILNKKDNDKVLNTLRNFRDNVLQKDKEYYDILKDYDIIGPIISSKISSDKDREIIAKYLYNAFLTPITENINNKEHSKAIKSYKTMTLYLINHYNLINTYILMHNYNKHNLNSNFNPKTAGHGKKLIKQNND